MKVNGNILLDKKGSFSNINQHKAEYAVYDFASMVKEADESKDTLFYDSDEWFQFYAKNQLNAESKYTAMCEFDDSGKLLSSKFE